MPLTPSKETSNRTALLLSTALFDIIGYVADRQSITLEDSVHAPANIEASL